MRTVDSRTPFSLLFIQFCFDHFWCCMLRPACRSPTPVCLLADQLNLLYLTRRPSRCGQNAGRGGEGAGPRCGKKRGGETGGAEAAGRGEKGQICQDGSGEGNDETRHQGQGTVAGGGQMEVGGWRVEGRLQQLVTSEWSPKTTKKERKNLP